MKYCILAGHVFGTSKAPNQDGDCLPAVGGPVHRQVDGGPKVKFLSSRIVTYP